MATSATMRAQKSLKPVSMQVDASGLIFVEEFIETDKNWTHNIHSYTLCRDWRKIFRASLRKEVNGVKHYLPLNVLVDAERFISWTGKNPESPFGSMDRVALFEEAKRWIKDVRYIERSSFWNRYFV